MLSSHLSLLSARITGMCHHTQRDTIVTSLVKAIEWPSLWKAMAVWTSPRSTWWEKACGLA
jgi:hypothetical protein